MMNEQSLSDEVIDQEKQILIDNEQRENEQRISDLMMSVAWAVSSTTKQQGKEMDRLLLHDAINESRAAIADIATLEKTVLEPNSNQGVVPTQAWQGVIRSIVGASSLFDVEVAERPDPARLPVIVWLNGSGWGVVRHRDAQQQWVIEGAGGQYFLAQADAALPCIRLVSKRFETGMSEKPVYKIFQQYFLEHKKTFIEASFASVVINLLAIITSLYSMQVYDRVIPTQGYSTLLVLTLGVVIALFFDIVIKIARSYLMEGTIKDVDSKLSRTIVARLLNIRMDQLPSSVGSLSAQLRGYETIRSFLSTSTFYLLVDAPFSLFFILLIAVIGSPLVALVPLLFFCVAMAFGMVMRKKVDEHATQGTAAGNRKTGLLVEAIEGAETIKSGGGNWKFLSKWIDVNAESMYHETSLKSMMDKSSYFTGLFQQISYISLIAVGAYLAGEGTITMGSLIACSILSGRALGPISQIPGLMVQAAHSKAALALLEKLYELETDNHGVDRPLTPDEIQGNYQLERVRFAYGQSPKALTVGNLKINHGEKIGVLGPVGSGKSTLLRLLSGMYQASEGRILLDGLDIDQISRHLLGEKIGYLQQDHRLFSGTLRENLLIGIPDPGDSVIKAAAAKTGLLTAIANHPKGLDLVIAEGGKGLSGGQRQLVALTRLLISHPSVWLLDEPTASMDHATEVACINAVKNELKPEDTLVLVTHKTSLLPLVNRIIVVVNHQILMDGPRDEILKRLSNSAVQNQATK
jgi:ATP-binding cassette subfamily C protein LapB